MKHDRCTHESTPKARAACRRAQGSIPEFVPAADKAALQSARDKMAARKNKTIGERLDAALTKRHAGVTKRDPDRVDTLARLRKVGAPEEWHSQIHFAWNQGWPVRYESSRDSDTQRLVIDAARGIVQLVWSGDRRAYWFTPSDTSVSRQCISLPVVMSVASGRR